MLSHRALQTATRTAAAALLPLVLLYAASFLFTFSRISLAGTTIILNRGHVRAHWLATPTPWRSSVPAPGWHIHRGPVGLRFQGQPAFQGIPSPMYGSRSLRLRAEYLLAPLTLTWLALCCFTRRRRPPGLCRRCGYDQSGLPAGAPCPECGPPPLPARALAMLARTSRAAPQLLSPQGATTWAWAVRPR